MTCVYTPPPSSIVRQALAYFVVLLRISQSYIRNMSREIIYEVNNPSRIMQVEGNSELALSVPLVLLNICFVQCIALSWRPSRMEYLAKDNRARNVQFELASAATLRRNFWVLNTAIVACATKSKTPVKSRGHNSICVLQVPAYEPNWWYAVTGK